MTNTGKGLTAAAWILSILGIVLLVVSSFQYLQIRKKKSSWIPVEGIVVNFIVDIEKGGAAPIIIYLWEQDTLAYTSTAYSTPPEFELRDKTVLFINPTSPDEVLLDGFQIYLFSLVLFVIGIVFNLIGLGIIFFSKSIG